MDVAYYNYIAVFVLTLMAVSVPASFLEASWFLRPAPAGNSVKMTTYESAEEPIGKTRDVDNEYISYFALFLPFEIVGVILLLWALAAGSLDLLTNVLAMGLAVMAMCLALIGYKFTSDKHV